MLYTTIGKDRVSRITLGSGGFDDAFYFSRLFKKTFGKSPREYRGQEEDN